MAAPHDSLQALSPLDGRYREICNDLRAYFSEASLIRYRIIMEVEYFLALHALGLKELDGLPGGTDLRLRALCKHFSNADAARVKEIESVTRHDVKAVEYFLKERFDEMGLGSFREFVHFGLTSQDINNTAIPLSFKAAMDNVMIPALNKLMQQLKHIADEWMDIPMLAHTHGQPASPTMLGKELLVFHERLENQLKGLNGLPYPAKFGGATGNFNAHLAAYPEVAWNTFADNLLSGLGLQRSQTTTQIDHYDGLSALFDAMKRICSILIDLDRDCWTYISMGYFRQQIKAGEVGSSAMPHKVNPIDFENAEGNAGLAVALFEHLSAKLPVSRLQRDLTDSTVLRNIGVPLGHMLIALKSSQKGLEKIQPDKTKIQADLDNNLEVVSEAIQTILRKLGHHEPYEALSGLVRKQEKISRESLNAFIDQLSIPDEEKIRLKALHPAAYTGYIPRKGN